MTIALRLFLVALVLAATPAVAQQAPAAAPPPAPVTGEAEFGGRVGSVSGDPARFQRHRDERDGLTLDRARYTRTRERWEFQAALAHAGYRDQRYSADFNQYGKLRASFQWDQVPFFYSVDTRTPFV